MMTVLSTIKVVFVKDAPAMVQTGQEYYPAGVDADLRVGHAKWLIDNGYARAAGAVELPAIPLPAPVEPQTVDVEFAVEMQPAPAETAKMKPRKRAK